MKSILQDKRECFITGRTDNLHLHHVFYGSNRKLSEQYGLKIYLVGEFHNQSNKGIHFNKQLDLTIKKVAQEKAMSHYGWDIQKFISIFGRNYL